MFSLLFSISVVCVVVVAAFSFINSKNMKGLIIFLIVFASPAIFLFQYQELF
ncbi:hypothetical protein [Citrobacter freundii]|uniref:Uncharacterized protein n=1 Tax=Citrobacter freundii TaxID=546 RepID=A0A7G2ITG7_CITFR|nr:hypothetical protein [Citrobacter freundii]